MKKTDFYKGISILFIACFSLISFAQVVLTDDIGLRVYNGNETIGISAAPLGTLTSPLRIAKDGNIYGIVLVEPGDINDSGVRIQTSSGIKALRRLGGYSLDYLARKYSGYGGTPWYALVENSLVIASDAYCIYSTSQGAWSPSDTNTRTLRLNVDGERNVTGKDPQSGFQVRYRVWDDTKVRVQTKTWGNHGQIKLNRVDTFQRESKTSILINGIPYSISIGGSYQVERKNWNPGDHGSGYSYLNVINVCSTYFDVQQVVWEYDEQFDSAYAKIDSYMEKY